MAPVLGYWDIRGLAQPIRLLLKYADVKFDEKLYVCGPPPDYDKSGWLGVKQSLGLDFPNLPYYIDGNTKLSQSTAILRHIARKHGLDGKNEDEKDRIEMVAEQMADLRRSWGDFCYGIGSEQNEETVAEYLKKASEHLQQLSKFLGDNDWISGKHISWVDFIVYEVLYQHRAYKADILASYPNLQKFLDRFEQLPKIKAYIESSEYINYPFNDKMALWGG